MDANRPIDERPLNHIVGCCGSHIADLDEVSRRIDAELFGASPAKEPSISREANCLKNALSVQEDMLCMISNRLRAISNRLRESDAQQMMEKRAADIAGQARRGLVVPVSEY